jgi:hypothetical protein
VHVQALRCSYGGDAFHIQRLSFVINACQRNPPDELVTPGAISNTQNSVAAILQVVANARCSDVEESLGSRREASARNDGADNA